MIVPALCVGMHPVTLRVASRKTRNVRRFIDAERRGLHYHAERGNDQTPSRLKPVPQCVRGQSGERAVAAIVEAVYPVTDAAHAALALWFVLPFDLEVAHGLVERIAASVGEKWRVE